MYVAQGSGMQAQTEHLALEANKAASTLQSKLQRRAKLLVAARQALLKHENAPTTMTDKDWIDIIRWVLPESNADGLLKDLRKKDVSIQTLLSLDQIGNCTSRLLTKFRYATP